MTVREVFGIALLSILMLGGLGMMLYPWVRPLVMRWRTRHFVVPEVTAADEALARQVVAEIARETGVEEPKIKVVPWLGRPLPGWSGVFGSGGVGVTKFSPWLPTTIVLATGATRDLSPAAFRHLVAHEMGHVALHATRDGRRRNLLLALTFIVALNATWATAHFLFDVEPFFPVALVVLVGIAIKMKYMRRGEFAADRFAILLTRDLDAARELNAAYEKHAPEKGRNWLGTLGGLLSTHPERVKRLESMAAILEETPAPQGDPDDR